MALLEVNDLKTYYITLRGPVKAVDGVSFQVEKGEAMGLAGESGCGKTTVALSLLRILPPGGKILGGEILFNRMNLVNLDEDAMREKVRWKGISLIFQGAMNALNPVYTARDQIIEAIRTHEPDVSKDEAKRGAEKLFEMVGIEPSRINNYPHEFSGGMKQRAMIAMALACNPLLLIADEPATALDVIIQAQVLKLIRELKEKLSLSMILITHDLSIIAETCEKVAIMYAGKIVEYGDITTIYKEPLHPYSQGLIGAFPNIRAPRSRMISVPGFPPDLLSPPSGCRFHTRCGHSKDLCREKEPQLLEVKSKHQVACHLIG
ncbi:MAG: putative ABC transporter ATP-binding protein [Candidatus Bathyarchaeota archaeon BA1]|nr:MAG: putative ABC transporter ATP-binding protein [Candidatus Bathyarchaeota archaeon BA1]